MSIHINPVPSPWWTGEEPCQLMPELFHPESGDHSAARIARWICRRCPSQQPCLDWALAEPALMGIHAGTTSDQRAHMRRAKR